jgi:hypothetical protein
MASLRFFKVTALPTTPVADAFYYVLAPGATAAAAYLTSSAGVLLPILNTDLVEELISQGGGGSTGGAFYRHDQTIAAAVWNITHSLGKYPSVVVVDSAYDVVEGSIQYISATQVRITFSSAFSGSAFLN